MMSLFLKKKIIDKLISNINNIKNKLANSINNDFDYKFFQKNNLSVSHDFLNIDEIIEGYINYLQNISKNIFLNKKLKGSWNFINNQLNITTVDFLPFGNLKIEFSEPVNPNTLKISSKYHSGKIPFKIINKKNIIIESILVADRVPYSFLNTKQVHDRLKIRPTHFSFNFNDSVNIKSLKVENIFSKKYQNFRYSIRNGFKPSAHNYIVINKKITNQKILAGNLIYLDDTIFNNQVLIKPGTKIFLGKGVSLIFKNKVIFNGSNINPIIVKRQNKNQEWGSISIIGERTEGSIIKYTNFDGGSGDKVNNYYFTAMLSLHNLNKINIDNVTLSNNDYFDDMMHIVYGSNIKISNSKFTNIFSDAIDIDSSNNISINNIAITNSKNDCLDFMQSNAVIEDSTFINCQDKGVSVGERSNILITNSKIVDSKIGVESKDDSLVKLVNTRLFNNKTALNAYKKNWRYGNGGIININNVEFKNNNKKLNFDKYSNINE